MRVDHSIDDQAPKRVKDAYRIVKDFFGPDEFHAHQAEAVIKQAKGGTLEHARRLVLDIRKFGGFYT